MSSSRVRLPARVRDARAIPRGTDSLAALLASAQARARAEGVLEGRALERAEATRRIDEVAEALESDRLAALEEVGRSAVAIGTAIARSLLKHEIGQGNYDLEAIVRETLGRLSGERGACRVHLNPADCARLEGVAFRTGTVLAPDDEVAPGDVHVETPVGLLVRETRAALVEIEQRLLEELR